MARPATAQRTQEERTEEAKGRLRQAALALFADDGYEATSLAAISLKAGFSRTLAQYHYPDKGALALELLEERILRDNHLEMLDLPDEVSAERAWQALNAHLDELARYYDALHGGSEQSTRLRGEMAIHAAALMSTEPAIKTRVKDLTRDQIVRIERLLETCRGEGMIPSDTDSHAMAVLHVHSIWGLALALFANPKGGRQIGAAFRQIGVLLEGLRAQAREHAT